VRFFSFSQVKGNGLRLAFEKGSCLFDISKTKPIEEVAVNANEGEITEIYVTLENSCFY